MDTKTADSLSDFCPISLSCEKFVPTEENENGSIPMRPINNPTSEYLDNDLNI